MRNVGKVGGEGARGAGGGGGGEGRGRGGQGKGDGAGTERAWGFPHMSLCTETKTEKRLLSYKKKKKIFSSEKLFSRTCMGFSHMPLCTETETVESHTKNSFQASF